MEARLLTVHLVTPRVVPELAMRLPSFDRLYYQRQPQHAVLVAVPRGCGLAAPAVAEQLGLTPGGHSHAYALGTSRTTIQVLSLDASLPHGMHAVNRTAPVATCAGMAWSRDYALYSGAWFSYHLLRLPILRNYEFYVKVDTDVMFVAPMPDLVAILAAHPMAQIAHTGLRRSNDCERGIMRAVHRFEGASNSSALSQWCNDPISHYFYGNLLAFRTSFMTSSRVLALSAHLYEHEWRGYFGGGPLGSRWGDQAPYVAFACYALHTPSASLVSADGGHILDLSYLRDVSALPFLRRARGTFRHLRIGSGRPPAEWTPVERLQYVAHTRTLALNDAIIIMALVLATVFLAAYRLRRLDVTLGVIALLVLCLPVIALLLALPGRLAMIVVAVLILPPLFMKVRAVAERTGK